jgi:hypothetical protein
MEEIERHILTTWKSESAMFREMLSPSSSGSEAVVAFFFRIRSRRKAERFFVRHLSASYNFCDKLCWSKCVKQLSPARGHLLSWPVQAGSGSPTPSQDAPPPLVPTKPTYTLQPMYFMGKSINTCALRNSAFLDFVHRPEF